MVVKPDLHCYLVDAPSGAFFKQFCRSLKPLKPDIFRSGHTNRAAQFAVKIGPAHADEAGQAVDVQSMVGQVGL